MFIIKIQKWHILTCNINTVVINFLVPFRHGERIGFSYLVSQKYIGDNALVRVLRNSETLEFNIKLAKHKELIPSHIEGKPPSYYIIAGFVFTAVTVPYLRSEVSLLIPCSRALSFSLNMVFLSIPVCLFVSVNLWIFINLQFGNLFDVPIKLLDKHLHAMAQSIDEQLVVVSQVCPSHSVFPMLFDRIVSSVYSAFLAQVYSNCSRYLLLILILDMRTLLTIRSENLYTTLLFL